MSSTMRHRPRILYLTKVVPYPPAVTGDAVYTRGVIEACAAVADVTAVCAGTETDREPAPDGIDWHVVDGPRPGRAGSVLSPLPLIAWKGATAGFGAEVERLLTEGQGWDAVVLDNIGTAHALGPVATFRRRHPATRVVYVSHEWEHATRASKYGHYRLSPATRALAAVDLAKVRRWEDRLIRTADVVTVINEADLIPFRRIDSSHKYLVLTPGYDGPVTTGRTLTDQTPRRLLIVGGRRSAQKQQILLDWLEVAERPLSEAGVEQVVVGDLDERLRDRLAHEYPRVRVAGFAPDLEAEIAEARAGLVVDTVGGGFKLRLLSHVFQRLPIIGLESAIDGLPTPAGEGYLAARSLDGLVRLVLDAIDRPDVLDVVQQRAFSDCAHDFSWADRARALAAVLGGDASSVLV